MGSGLFSYQFPQIPTQHRQIDRQTPKPHGNNEVCDVSPRMFPLHVLVGGLWVVLVSGRQVGIVTKSGDDWPPELPEFAEASYRILIHNTVRIYPMITARIPVMRATQQRI